MSEETSPLNNINDLLSSNYYFFVLTVGFFIFKIINVPNNLFTSKKVYNTNTYTMIYIVVSLVLL